MNTTEFKEYLDTLDRRHKTTELVGTVVTFICCMAILFYLW